MLHISELRKLSSFKSVNDLDHNIRNFLYHHKFELSEGTYNVLRDLQRHSVKYIGVSFSKYATIAKRVSLSPRTVMRAIQKLIEYGILSKIKTRTNNGKQGSNVFVFLPFTQQGHADSHAECHSDETKENPCESKSDSTILGSETEYKQSKNYKSNSSNIVMDATFTPSNVHQSFIDVCKSFFNASDVYSLWRRVKIAYNKSNLSMPLETYTDTIVSVLKQTVFMSKQKQIKSFFGYFYTGVLAEFSSIKRKEVISGDNCYYNFLEQ